MAKLDNKPRKPTADDYVGHWELVPAESKYDLSQVPKAARLDIKSEKGGLFIRLEWTDHVGAKGEIDHSFPFKQPVMVNGNEYTLALNDDGSLETVVQTEEGKELSRTKRTLSDDRKQMQLVQSGARPDAGTYTNLSVYKRVR